MPKNNDKELLNKISFCDMFPFLGFSFSGADFYLRGEGGSIDYASKSRLSCYLRLKNCKLIGKDVSISADVEIFPFEEYIKTFYGEELSQPLEELFKYNFEWKKVPNRHWGNGYINYTRADLSLYCTENEFQFIQNMLLYDINNKGLLKKTSQKLSLTTIISHPNFLGDFGIMEKAFYEPGVWYDHGVFCVDDWTMKYSD